MTPGEFAAPQDARRSAADRLFAHLQIIYALGVREVQSRFGHNAFGYSWAYVTPLLWLAGTYFAFTLFGRSSPVYTDTITFIISGLVPYVAFRMTVTALTRVNNTMRGLVIFPSVTLEHGAATVALIEFINIFIVFAIVAALNYLVFGNGELEDPVHFVFGMSLAWGLGASYGYLVSVLGRFDRTFQEVGVILLRPTFFLSAVFFTANELPDRLLSVLIYNPVLHAVEITRDGMLFHYQSRVDSPIYVVGWIAGLMAAALLIRLLRKD